MNLEKCPRRAICVLVWFAIILATASTASASWKEKVLYSFQGGTDGIRPVGGVIRDSQGNLYGATIGGGNDNCSPMAACGTVYQLAPQKDGSWTETVLYVFKGKAFNDGEYPEGGVIADSAGNLYGTAAYGGSGDCVLAGTRGGCGTVFELSPPQHKGEAWTETILYSFPTAKQGYVPSGDLVFDKSGNLYGSTIFGGGQGTTCDPFYQYCGAVFELSPPKTKGGKWTEKVLHSFAGVATGQDSGDGANPNGTLVLDSKGAVYGTTYYGGNNQKGTCEGGAWGTGCGIVFKLTPPSYEGGEWKENAIHRFDGEDGDNPTAGVVFGEDGDLYCTTYAGGGGRFPSGSAVQLVPEANGTWTRHTLHSFQDNGDGGIPQSGLTFDSKGNLYGTASEGGTVGGGTLFRLRPTVDSWSFTTLYDFMGPPDGSYPSGNLIFDTAGNLYGTTQYSGTGQACGNYGCGTVFKAGP